MQRGSFELMKKINQQVILEIIYEHTLISRARIAEITGLSPATVSNLIKELLSLKLVRETSRGESRGGRKPVLLELNPTGAYFIGIEWGITSIKGILMDLSKKIVMLEEIPVVSFQAGYFINKSCELIAKFRQKVQSEERIKGVGIGIHGLVDPEKGVSLFAPHFKWENKMIKEELRKKLKIPILLDNDVRMMALAEKWEGNNNFIFINTGPGIGAAIVLDGRLHFGRDYSAGEFGHMTILEQGPICSCGNHGCLESLISVEKLIQLVFLETDENLSVEYIEEKWQQLIKQAKNGQTKALEVVTTAARHLGTGIANIINLLNPESVIIGGAFTSLEEIMFPVMKDQVKEKALKISSKKLKIKAATYGDKVGTVGAATRVLQELFKLNEGDDI